MKVQNLKLKVQNSISAIVITKNEEERIGQCLKSLTFAYEVIVVE